MVNEPSQQERSAVEMCDLEQLLCDAYDVPDVPRSLLRRLDGQIARDWGCSPELAVTRWGKAARSVSRKTAWVRAIPAVALASILVFAIGIFTAKTSAGSVWAEMLKALETQDVAQMQIPGGTRWMSLSDGIIIEEREQSVTLWNFEQNLLLTRPAGTLEPRRQSLPSDSSLSQRDRTVLSFLLGASALEETTGLRLTEKRSTTAETARGREMVLFLSLTDDSGANWEVQLTIDEQTHLPTSCEINRDRQIVESNSLTYPSLPMAEIRQRQFPEERRGVAVAELPNPPARGQDGNSRDVASTNEPLQRLEPTVPWQAPDAVPSRWESVQVRQFAPDELVNRIDSLLENLWNEKGIEPTGPAGHTELLRRVYLDLTGRTPTVAEVRSYLKDSNPDRYERLVDRLLGSPDHASHLATIWRKVLIPEGIDLTRFGGVEAFDRWLADEFAAGTPYDEIASDLLLAEGRLSKSGPLLFYTALKLDPDQIASRASRVFLGMRLECAECHDHPFEPWKQTDFWNQAAFFAQISRPKGELEQASRVMRVADVDRGEVMLPETELVVEPKFLDGTPIDAFGGNLPRRERFVRWLTDPRNPYFARATANRVWGQLFGKGIIDPVDNFGVQNKPRIPEIIDLLAGHLIASDFRLSEILRAVVHTRAYRLSSGAESADPQRLEWFAQMQVKMLSAEQIYDCISVATLLDTENAQNLDSFNLVRFRNPAREEFVQQFSTPAGSMTDYQAGIPQALTLMNGTLIAGATGISSSGLLKSLEAPFFNNRERIEVLYLATLSRPPEPSEWRTLEQYLPMDATGEELKNGLADLLWVLLNSAEFTMNH